MYTYVYQTLSTGTTVLNTTAETALYTFSIPSNLFRVGNGVRLMLAGSILGADSTNPTVTLRSRIKVNGSTGAGTLVMATSALTLTTSTSARSWVYEQGAIATSTATQAHWARMDVGGAGTASAIKPNTYSLTGRGASTRDYNERIDLSVTAQLSFGSTQYTLNGDIGVLELIRP